jgi:uncharacterized repeat protein (TIGR01451 family)
MHPKIRTVVSLIFLSFIVAWIGPLGTPTHTASAQGDAIYCFSVSDVGDALWRVERATGTSTSIGILLDATNFRYRNVEAIAMNLDGTVLYAADVQPDPSDPTVNIGVFIRINLNTAAVTRIGQIGPGNGRDPGTGTPTTARLDDVDSLSIHPWTGEMWGITQDLNANKIFRINLATGQVVPNTFGPGLDYVTVSLPNPPRYVDDLAIDPDTGTFYIIANEGINDRLYVVNVNGADPQNSPGLNSTLGTVSSFEVAPLTDGGTPPTNIVDMEGLGFFNDGTLYGTTGDNPAAIINHMWVINKTTGVATSVTPGEIDSDGVDPQNSDYESIGCLTAGENLKGGVVFEDVDSNGAFGGMDTVYAGATVRFYRDNGNGVFDGAPTDSLVQTAVTGAAGTYSFTTAAEGTYFAVVDTSTLPAGSSLTTAGIYTVNFVGFGNNLVNNNFGFALAAVPTASPIPTDTPPGTDATPTSTSRPPDDLPTPTPIPGTFLTPDAPAPAIVKVANPPSTVPGGLVTFTITVSNNGALPLTGVVVTDDMDGAFFASVVEASTTKGTVSIQGLRVTVTIGDLAPGEAAVITIVARVRTDVPAPDAGENVAVMVSNERDPVSSRAVVGLVTMPGTGYPPDPSQRSAISLTWALPAMLGLIAVGATLLALRRRHAR